MRLYLLVCQLRHRLARQDLVHLNSTQPFECDQAVLYRKDDAVGVGHVLHARAHHAPRILVLHCLGCHRELCGGDHVVCNVHDRVFRFVEAEVLERQRIRPRLAIHYAAMVDILDQQAGWQHVNGRHKDNGAVHAAFRL
eukprot:6211977-Pleurochrysis_carterae.AAC.1